MLDLVQASLPSMSEKRRGSSPVEWATKFASQICNLASILQLGCSLALIIYIYNVTLICDVLINNCNVFVPEKRYNSVFVTDDLHLSYIFLNMSQNDGFLKDTAYLFKVHYLTFAFTWFPAAWKFWSLCVAWLHLLVLLFFNLIDGLSFLRQEFFV